MKGSSNLNSNTNAFTRKNMRGRINQQMEADFLRPNHSVIHIENLKKHVTNWKAEEKEFALKLIKQLEYHLNSDNTLCKYDFLGLLEGYKFFNKDKFNLLSRMCFADKLLAALDFPKRDKTLYPYFAANTNIEIQQPLYTQNDVGDSDDEFDQDANLRWFTLDRPLTPPDTTVRCIDGHIKGDMLIHATHLVVYAQLNEYHDEFTPFRDGESGEIIQCGMGDYNAIGYLGNYMFEQSAVSEKEPCQQLLDETVQKTIHHPGHNIVFTIEPRGITTRLINPELKIFDIIESSRDLTYKKIDEVNQSVLQHLKNKLNIENIDKELAKIQLARLRNIEKNPDNSMEGIFESYGTAFSPEEKMELIIWVDYLNTLIFRIEVARINTTLITGLMMLKLIEHGDLTYKQAFYDSSAYLGQFPGASIATKHNFKTRAQLLYNMGTVGMQADRQNARWLMCTLKESMIMLNWFKVFVLEGRNPMEHEQKSLMRDFSIYVHVLLQDYMAVSSEM